MSNSSSDKAGLPAWFLILAVGGIAGIVLGGVFFFSTGDDATKSAPVTTTPAATPATTVAAATPKPASPVKSAPAITEMPTTLEGWNQQIASANLESYPALMDGVLRIGDGGMRNQVAETLLLKWLNADRETYLVYLDQLESSPDEGAGAWPVLVPAFVNVVPKLGEAAVQSPELEEAVQWMTDYYAEQNPDAALAWSRKWLLGDAQESAMATIAGQFAKTSLTKAEELARSIPTPSARLDALANIAAELGKQQPDKALAWARGLTDPDEKAAAVEEVMWSMADANPEAAAQQVQAMNDPEMLQNIGSTIAESLAAGNPQRGIAWAESVPAGAARDEAIVGAISGWAKKDPTAAFAYFQSKQGANADAAEGLFEQWASNDPKAAADQARQLATPEVREKAYTGIVNGWLNGADPSSVEQWVDQLPPGKDRDVASATLVDAFGVNEPQVAWDRALTIKDAQVRQDAVLSAFSSLVQADEAGARAALNSNVLGEQEKKILTPILESISAMNAGSNVPPAPGGQ